MLDSAPVSTRHNGFSSIELLIVLVLFALLAALSLPAYQDYVERRTAATTFKIPQAKNGERVFDAGSGNVPTGSVLSVAIRMGRTSL